MSANPIMTPEAIARWWGFAPSLRSPVGTQRGTCAVWQFRSRCGDIEVKGDSDPHTHLISIYAAGVGTQEYFGDGRRRFQRRCRPGLVNIVPAGERPRAIISGDTVAFGYLHVYLPHSALTDVAAVEELAASNGIELIDPQLAEDAGIEQIGRTLIDEMRHSGPFARLRIDTMYQDLAIQLLRRHSSLAGHPALARSPARGGLAYWQLKRVLEAMEAHLGEDIGLDMLAGIAGCSPTHFSRAFKQSTGKPPFQWLLERRIARAKDFLARGQMSTAEVALAVGFSAQPQFTTAFKRITGSTPGAWRREHCA